MNLSLNEVEAMAKKATRGAGYAWGLAEEAAKATRWLSGRGVDGVAVLAAALSRRGGCAAAGQGGCRTCSACPLGAGPAVSDTAATLTVRDMRFDAVAQPMLLVPFAAMAARRIGATVTVASGPGVAVTDGTQLALSGSFPTEAAVAVSVGGTVQKPVAPTTRATPDIVAWAQIEALAHRTYAPATEESRALGAGAGLSDND